MHRKQVLELLTFVDGRYRGLKRQLPTSSGAQSGCFTNLNTPGIMYNQYTFMLDINEPNLTSVKERYKPILNGNDPSHKPPHLTIFEMKLNPKYFNDYKKREKELCEKIGQVLRNNFKSPLEHIQNEFDFFPQDRMQGNFYVKFYKTTLSNFTKQIEDVINEFFISKDITKSGKFIHNQEQQLYCFGSSAFKLGPVLSIPEYVYEMLQGGDYRPHLSIFNIGDVRSSNFELYYHLSKQDIPTRLKTIHTAQQNNLAPYMTDAKRWDEHSQRFTSEPRVKLLPFFDIDPTKCDMRITKKIQYDQGASPYQLVSNMRPS